MYFTSDEAKAREVLEVRDGPPGAGTAGGDPLLQTLGSVCERLAFSSPEHWPGHDPGKPGPIVLSFSRGSFQFPTGEQPVLRGLELSMMSTSRVGIVGRTGAGKSTLLPLIAGQLRPSIGDLWSYDWPRTVYVGQPHGPQLGDYLRSTPAEYMPAAKAKGKRGRDIENVLGRQIAGKDQKDVSYEVKWSGLTPAENTFEKRSRFKTMGVEYMIEEYDSWIANAWGGSVL